MIVGNLRSRLARGIGGISLLALQLVTLTGALLVRRRWHSALLFAGGLATLALLVWQIGTYGWRQLTADRDALEVYPWLIHLHAAYLVALAATVALAALVAIRPAPARPASRGLIAVAVLMSTIAWIANGQLGSRAWSLVSLYLTQGGIGYEHADHRSDERPRYGRSIDFANAYRAGTVTLLAGSGGHVVRGRIHAGGKPVRAAIKLQLNDYWRTPIVRSDADGNFAFSLALGDLVISRIDLERWYDVPAGPERWLPVLREPRLPFDHAFFDKAQYRGALNLARDRPAVHADIDIELVPFIELAWPKRQETEQVGEPDATQIEWASVRNAAYYQLRIGRYDDDASGSPHLERRVDSNAIRLSDLPLTAAAAPSRYYVDIAAFDAEGRFVGTSESGFSRMRFSIRGHDIVGDPREPSPCHSDDAGE